jgi:alpha-acetolactate decarboxylase
MKRLILILSPVLFAIALSTPAVAETLPQRRPQTRVEKALFDSQRGAWPSKTTTTTRSITLTGQSATVRAVPAAAPISTPQHSVPQRQPQTRVEKALFDSKLGPWLP